MEVSLRCKVQNSGRVRESTSCPNSFLKTNKPWQQKLVVTEASGTDIKAEIADEWWGVYVGTMVAEGTNKNPDSWSQIPPLVQIGDTPKGKF